MANNRGTQAGEMSPEGAKLTRPGTVVSLDARGHARVRVGEDWFVAKGPVPGDKLSVTLPAQGRKLRTWTLEKGAEGRRVAPCVVQEACGGCTLMSLDPMSQRAVLLDRIRHAFCAQSLPEVPVELEAGPELGYRNRIRLRVNERSELTFFNGHKSEGCAVLEPSLRAALKPLLKRPLDAWKGVRFIELRACDLDGRLGMYVVPMGAGPGSLHDGESLKVLFEGVCVQVAGTPTQSVQRFPLSQDLFVYAPLGSFVQVNFAMNARLVQWVTEQALASGARSFWDLFCGVGNFSLPLLKGGLTGLGVELDAFAVEAATRASNEQGLCGQFIAADAGSWLETKQGELTDLILVDAPRAGFGAHVGLAARCATKAIILVSCCPETLARDVRVLSRAGWTLTGMRGFEMFPQTHHVEVAALLRPPVQV
ncbi:MAG: hypothetical protein SFV15_08925 [Polyangiaceae bacterium]|nr:hypothetical protein [Polyangiaceae bacterium]